MFDQRSALILLMKFLHLVQKRTFRPFISGLISLFYCRTLLIDAPLNIVYHVYLDQFTLCYLVIMAVKLTSLMTVFECNHEVLLLI